MNIKKISDNMIELEARDPEHTPYIKSVWDIEKAFCSLNVRDYDGNGPNPDAWTELLLSETYTRKGGKRPVRREISMTLNSDQRKALLEVLLRKDVTGLE